MFFLQLAKLWIGVSALASLAGWILSMLGELNQIGYIIFSSVIFLLAVFYRRRLQYIFPLGLGSLKKNWRRLRRPFPACFAVLALLIFLGGALYPPNNHTALSYRIPRVMQWLAHGKWLWIHTACYRMNDRACGIEWLSAPLLLFTKSDRGLFLLNFIPFVLLPGFVFSVCTRLGVRAKIAWQWMWILPTGYSFLLQAGSAGNDTFPTLYALAAVDFGLRAWTESRKQKTESKNYFSFQLSSFSFSLIAAALLTGAKASNLPLLLPWFILIFSLFVKKLLGRETAGQKRSLWSAVSLSVVCLIAAAVSFLPNAILNWIYCGDWSGAKLEPAGMVVKNHIVGVLGNSFQILLDNFAPPFFPMAGWWNQRIASYLPRVVTAAVDQNFDTGFFALGELPTEDWAGLGFGVSMLLAISITASFLNRCRQKKNGFGVSGCSVIPGKLRYVLLLAPWIALLAYSAKSGMTTAARLISPYYPLLLPLLLSGDGHLQVVRRRWWRALVWINFIAAFAILILTPPRPLWPAQTILSQGLARKPESHLLSRAQKVYAVYAGRSDPLANVRALLPRGLRVIGFVGGEDDLDISFWRPYGTTRVEDILLTDSTEEIKRRGIEYAVVGGFNLQQQGLTFEAWFQHSGAELIATTHATVKVSEGEQPWYIVRFK